MRRLAASARIPLEAGFVGLIIGLLTVAPWVRGAAQGGFLLLTDWVSGPTTTVSPGVYGLSDEALDAMPWRLGIQLVRSVVGPAHAGWLLVLLPFPIAAAGAAHLVRSGRLASFAAALAMTCNPLVVERVAVGHVPFLWGMALLPWLIASARHARTQERWFSARTTGWLALSVSVSPHMAWVGGMALLLIAVVPRPTVRSMTRLVLVVLTSAGVYAYAIAVIVAGVPTIALGGADLAAFATRGDRFDLFVNAVSLRGFWRDSGDRIANGLGAVGPILLLIVAVVVVMGVIGLVRRGTTRGPLAVAFILVGAVMATGTHGPLGSAYAWAFAHVPLFEAMREPQKWSALVLIGIVIAVAGAVQQLVDSRIHQRARRTAAVLVAALPLTILPFLAWGVGGSIATSQYPQGWSDADAVLADSPTLFLPWHGYQPFTFTDGRSVATPAGAFFGPPMVVSAAVEVGPLRTNSTSRRQAALDTAIATAGGPDFAGTLADLGIRQVVIALDAAPGEDYSWVDRLPGLTPIVQTSTARAYRVDPPTPGADRLTNTGPTSFEIAPGTAGTVVLPVECSTGWLLDGRAGRCTEVGTLAFDVGSSPARVQYEPWNLIRPGLALSLLVLLGLVAGGLVEHAAELRRSRS